MVTTWGAVPESPTTIRAATEALLLAQLTDGIVRYVDSNASGAAIAGRTPLDAYATVDAAINASLAGDTIIALEGHAEAITLATELVPDVAGLKIIGLGRGARRPTITFDETTGEIPISGAGTVFSNFLLTISGTKDVVVGITVSGADVLLNDIEMVQPTATDEFVDAIILAAGSLRCEIGGLKFDGIAQGGATQSVINIPYAALRPHIHDMWAVGTFASGAIQNETAASLDAVIERVIIEQRHSTQDACIAMHANAKGFISDAYLRTATNDDAGMGAIVAAAMQMYNVRVVNADGEYGAADEMAALDVTDSRSGHTFSNIA